MEDEYFDLYYQEKTVGNFDSNTLLRMYGVGMVEGWHPPIIEAIKAELLRRLGVTSDTALGDTRDT